MILIHYWTIDIPALTLNILAIERNWAEKLRTTAKIAKAGNCLRDEQEARFQMKGSSRERRGLKTLVDMRKEADRWRVGRPITENKISHGTLVATYLWKISNSILDFPPKTGVQGRSEPPAASLTYAQKLSFMLRWKCIRTLLDAVIKEQNKSFTR